MYEKYKIVRNISSKDIEAVNFVYVCLQSAHVNQLKFSLILIG